MQHSSSNKPIAFLTNRKNTLQIFDVPAKLGRNDNVVDVYFFDKSLSREHCLFECVSRRFTVKDLGSTVGTFINGMQLEPGIPYYIEDGDKITIGKVKFVFKADYEALARKEQMAARGGMQQAAMNMRPEGIPQAGMHMPPQMKMQPEPYNPAVGNVSVGPDGKIRVTVSSRELVEYEFDENEVIYVDTGFVSQERKKRYTKDLPKEEIEAAAEPQGSPAHEIPAEPAAPSIIEEYTEPEREYDDFEDEATAVITDEPAQTGTSLKLRWVDVDSSESGELIIDHFPFYMGRKSADNDYVILKKDISRRHMHFSEKDGCVFVCDDNSSNGVRVNGARIVAGYEIRLMKRDTISAGNITFTVVEV